MTASGLQDHQLVLPAFSDSTASLLVIDDRFRNAQRALFKLLFELSPVDSDATEVMQA